MFAMGPISTRLAQFVPPRPQIVLGFFIAAAGMWVSRDVTPEWGFNQYLVLQITRSAGLALVMFTTQNITMGTLSPDLMKSAGSLVNLSRNLGGPLPSPSSPRFSPPILPSISTICQRDLP